MSQDRAQDHIACFDGLRAVAIAGVLAVHAGVPGMASGWLGVDLFFALSGYLVTSLLLKEQDRRGAISLKDFWARRFLRLMPIYYLYVLGISWAMYRWSGSVLTEHGGWSPGLYLASLWLYFVNLAPMGGIWNGQEVTIHLWSLAVEAQFYLLWPLLVVALARRPARLLLVSWMLCAACLAYFLFGAGDHERSSMLQARGMALALSSALAVTVWADGQGAGMVRRAATARVSTGALLLLLGLALAAGAARWLNEAQIRLFLLPPLVICFALLVLRYALAPQSAPGWLCHPLVTWVGRVSYGIYLYHEAVRVGVWWLSEDLFAGLPRALAYGARLMLYFGASFVLAYLSYRFLELPFLKLKDRFRSGQDAGRAQSFATQPSSVAK